MTSLGQETASGELLSDDGTRQAVEAALQQLAQGNQPGAIQALEPVTDLRNPIIDQLLAWLYTQTGGYEQGLPYAERVVDRGMAGGLIAINYMNWAQSNSTFRHIVPDFLKHAMDSGWQVDPFSVAQQLQGQGDTEGALRVLTASPRPTLSQAEQQWDTLHADMQAAAGRIDGTVLATEQARDAAMTAIAESEGHIAAEASRVTELVDDTTVLIQGAAAHHLANEYAIRADEARSIARRWTIATLVVSAMAIGLAATFVLLGVARNHDVTDILTKAGLSLPLIAIAAYLNKLGAEERRDARTWRHIELQIRTAQPYLSNLPVDMGKEVQAALALRFFPGQSQNPHGGEGDSNAEDVLSTLKEIQRRQASNAQPPAQ